ncbi:MAG: hypothetical protein A2W91_19985 [Bacteroidetes bacterium GWF2_38_335]|nr:MAG: hypothetical protein A2W91_19985 [Bacteroidetes bacterium GWF2_38_335]OFY82000.1 MAG: hypothetical protein A2281_09935 [Bacteroidetes bacterium RIFOXYA12_FULL_38_20]HBS86500.1 hypothetical protein [Bacteroidales bacterium]
MKKLFLILFAIIPFVINAQDEDWDDPIFYNDFIVEQQTDLMTLILEMNTALETGTAEEVYTALNQLQERTARAIDELDNMPCHKGDCEMIDAARKLFAFYALIFEDDYNKMIKLALKTELTDVELTEFSEIQSGIVTREAALDEAFLGAQKRFADKNGFTLSE